MRNTIVYLIGFPGVGKYSAAKELLKLQPNFRIVDNHLINNLIFTLIEKDDTSPIPEDVRTNILKIWDIVFDTLTNIADANHNFVLTNVLLESKKRDHEFYHKVRNMAEQRQALFVPIRLLCQNNELERRIVNPERKERHKLTNLERARDIIENDSLLNIAHPNLLNLETTGMTSIQVAQKVMNYVQGIQGK